MENREISREEMEALVEKAKKELQERLAQMTPEERAEAAAKAKIAIREDKENIERTLEMARKLTAKSEAPAPKFCSNCGSPVSGGNFCPHCGNRLR